MNKVVFETYAELEMQKRKIEEQQERIKEVIKKEMAAEQANEVKGDFGSFYLSERKTWKFSGIVTALDKELKEKKKEEKAKGVATFTSKPSVSYYPLGSEPKSRPEEE